MLEGPSAAVRKLFETIEQDLRHERCVILSEETITGDERRYPQWGMVQQSDVANVAQELDVGAWAKITQLLTQAQQENCQRRSLRSRLVQFVDRLASDRDTPMMA